jgi:hypothetical protein
LTPADLSRVRPTGAGPIELDQSKEGDKVRASLDPKKWCGSTWRRGEVK